MINTTLTTARRTRHDAHLGLFHRDQLRHNGVTIRLYWFGPLFASITTGRGQS